jgi:glycerol-3-phosphate dehydrogenase
MYDLLAGKENMASSYLMSRRKALETFPMLKSDGLVGAVVYYDSALSRAAFARYPFIVVHDNTTTRA